MVTSRAVIPLISLLFVYPTIGIQAADTAAGRDLFARKSCVACHGVGQGRQTLGPDLSKLEKKLTKAELLEALKEPDKKIRKGYESWVVLTDKGRVYTGRLLKKTDAELTLISADNNGVVQQRIIKADSVDAMKQSETSLMPRGLLKGVSDADIDNLLAYLHSLPDDKPFPAGVLTRVASAAPSKSARVVFESMPTVPGRTKFTTVDAEVTLTTVAKQMRYDKTVINVRPGAKLRLTLRNSDEMQHNLVLCKPGKLTWFDVAKSAWAMGADGPKRGFVPNSPLVVAATRQVPLGQQDTIDFQLPNVEGAYPFVCTLPGHAYLMRGEIIVSNSRHSIEDITYKYYEGNWQKIPNFDELEPKKSGDLAQISIKPRQQNNQFGFRFDAKLFTAVDGEYSFYLSSDDGSRIEIDGQTVVDNDGVHPDGDQRVGKVLLDQGEHHLRVLFFEAGGGESLHAAWSGPGLPLQVITEGTGKGRFQKQQQFTIPVANVAKVIRVNMPDASSRAIAVGLPGAVNYCFDAQSCEVRYGWLGAFLDVGPDRGYGKQRGGGVCKVLGERFEVGANGFPISLANANGIPKIRFLGYRRQPEGPTFKIGYGDITVAQKVTPSPNGTGLTHHFTFEGVNGRTIHFALKTDNVTVESSAGKWSDGILSLTGKDAESFTVTVEPKKN